MRQTDSEELCADSLMIMRINHSSLLPKNLTSFLFNTDFALKVLVHSLSLFPIILYKNMVQVTHATVKILWKAKAAKFEYLFSKNIYI